MSGCAGCESSGSGSFQLGDLASGFDSGGGSGGDSSDDGGAFQNTAPGILFFDETGINVDSIDIDFSVQTSLDLTVAVVDADGDETILDHIELISSPAGIPPVGIDWVQTEVGMYALTISNLSAGVFAFSAQATDVYGLSTNAMLVVSVNSGAPGNQPVSVIFTDFDCITPLGEKLVNGPLLGPELIYARVSDPDGDFISTANITELALYKNGLPTGANVSATMISVECLEISLSDIPQGQEASFDLQLALNDGVEGNPDGEAVFELKLNLPPIVVVDTPHITTEAPATVSVNITFDADLFGDATIEIESTNEGVTFNPHNSISSPTILTVSAPDEGVYSFLITAEDPQGLTSETFFVLTVENVFENTPPCIEFFAAEVAWTDDNDIRCAGTEDDDFLELDIHAGDPYATSVSFGYWDDDEILDPNTTIVILTTQTGASIVCDPSCLVDFQNLFHGGTEVHGVYTHVIKIEVFDSHGAKDEDYLLINVFDGPPDPGTEGPYVPEFDF